MYGKEEDNFKRIDAQKVHAYFKDPTFVEYLKAQNFDIGVGSPYLADSLLFRALGIPYIKLHPEDVESYAMHYKFNMPVMLSSYPHAKSYDNYEYGELPDLDSQRYRMQFNRNYLWSKFIEKPFHHMSPIREALPDNMKYLVDDFDQDHALILTEGTNVGIFQSIMMKPPNVQPIYPLRDESRAQNVTLDPSKKGPIIVFNIEPFSQ
jgi:hypothetical protein